MDKRKIIKKLFEQNGNKCAVCGRELTEDIVSIDHKLPRALGGSDDIDNLRLLCRTCNAAIGNPFNEYAAERYLCEVLMASDNFRNVKSEVRNRDKLIDIVAERREGERWKSIAIEVRSSNALTLSRINQIIYQLNVVQANSKNKYKFILAVFSKLTETALSLLQQNDIEVWDIEYIAKTFADEIADTPNVLFQDLLKRQLKYSQKSKEEEYIEKLKNCIAGKDHWSEYQKIVGEILSYLFCPPLSEPLKEKYDYAKVNRKDFVFPNYSERGFWAFLRDNYKADYIVVDAKNYAKNILKKDVLQIANYLKPHGAGLFGIIVSRNGYGESAYYCLREVWMQEKKLIVSLQDNDIEQMLLEKESGNPPENVIRQKIEDFRLSF